MLTKKPKPRKVKPTCTFCETPLDDSNWYASMQKECSYSCKSCHRTRPSQNYEGNKDAKLKREFGISLTDYNAMLEAQNGVCAICDRPEKFSTKGKGSMAMAVDHCHKTDKIRGLLCLKCNRAIGLFEDSTDSLQKAIDYLKRH